MAPRNPEQEKEILKVLTIITNKVFMEIISGLKLFLTKSSPRETSPTFCRTVLSCVDWWTRSSRTVWRSSRRRYEATSGSTTRSPLLFVQGPAFLLMENVQSFLSAAKKYGVPDEEVFQTPDLFEARNIPQVSLCIFSLGKVAALTWSAKALLLLTFGVDMFKIIQQPLWALPPYNHLKTKNSLKISQ